MPTLLQQLENNEAVLLMYLADELPAADRAEVEQMLASDAGMRAELEAIGSAHTDVLAVLREFDRQSPPAVSGPVAVRQVSRAMKQWHLDRFSERQPVAARKALRFPWWAYSAASAAAIVLAVLVWWGLRLDSPLPGRQEVAVEDDDPATLVAVSLLNQENIGAGLIDAELQASLLTNRSDAAEQAADRLLIDPAQLN